MSYVLKGQLRHCVSQETNCIALWAITWLWYCAVW